MGSTLDLPVELLEERNACSDSGRRPNIAVRALPLPWLPGLRSKTDIVVPSSSESLHRKRIDELRDSPGSVTLNIDTAASRRRSRR